MHHNALSTGYRLQWFSIEQVLGQGDCGVTYLAHDSILDRHVAIKEFLPVKLAVRDGAALIRPITEDYGEQYLAGLEIFIDEARRLAKVEHPNVVRVLNVFVANNTAYMVMAYEEGESLRTVLEHRGTLEQGELLKFLIPILSGLEKIHEAGFFHGNISPASIVLRKDGSPVLLDFGFARQTLGEKTQTLSSMLTPGYAAVEQYYGKSDRLGPWTDIYGLGATLYRCIAGVAPPDALERSQTLILASKDILVPAEQAGGPRYSEKLLRAIDHALSLNPPKRPQSIPSWRREFSSSPEPLELPVEEPPKKPEPKVESLIVEPADASVRPPIPDAPLSRILVFSLTVSLIAGGFIWLSRETIEEPERLTASSDFEQTGREDKPADTGQSANAEPQDLASTTPASPPGESTGETNADVKKDPAKYEGAEIDALFELLARAAEDIRAGRLISPKDNNALAKFRSVLALDPDQPQAKQGIKEIVDRFAQPAREAMARRDWDQALARIDEVTIVLPEAEILREELNTRKAEAAKESSEAQASQKPAEQATAQPSGVKQVSQSPDEVKTTEARGDTDPSASEKDTRRNPTVDRLIGRAWRALNRQEWDKAQTYIDQAAAILGDAEVQTLRRQLSLRKAKASESKQAAKDETLAENTGTTERDIPPADQTVVTIRSATATPRQVSPGETVEFVTTYDVTLPSDTTHADIDLTWVLKAGGRRIGKEGSDFKLATAGINTASNEFTVPSYMKSGTYTVEHRVRAGTSKAVAKSYFSVVRKPKTPPTEVAPSEPPPDQ
ncbi:serine/threonine protein kinase [Methylocaldum szegediense]|nr:serine/threonine-protein kinase [Methylocaldum szegediense]